MLAVDRSPTLDAGRFCADAARSYTLPGSVYTDPAVYEAEKAAVFHKSWIFAGACNALAEPGCYTTVQIAGQNIVVVRGTDRRVRAFYNVCSHRAHELLTGSGRTGKIVCPYHAWSYELDGKLRSSKPFAQVAEFDTREFCLKAVRLEEFLGFLFINLDPAARPLAEQAAGLDEDIRKYCREPETLKFAGRLTFDIRANWKNVVDNFQECYHCPGAHPALVQLFDHGVYRTRNFGIASSHIAPGRDDNAAYKFDPGAPGAQTFYGAWLLWPNLTLNVFPGRRNISFMHIMPTGPETTLEHWDFFLEDERPNAEEQAAMDYVKQVLQPEDIGLVESVQRGLHSKGYTQGRFVVNSRLDSFSEHGVHHFQSMWLRAMNGGL
jgi:phenylpropionate dioxygenase-like ring-hydroxylating dioxygenase large terminal subunit